MSKTNDQPHFVWVKGLRGPEAQKWAELDFGVSGWKRDQVLAAHPITREEFEKFDLNTLKRIYPAPKRAEAA